MIKVLITGANGFIGKHLIEKLNVEKNYSLVLKTSKDGRVENEDTWIKFPKADVLIHLAAKSFVPDSWKNPNSYLQTNVLGTQNAINYCKKNNARIIFISSYLYGNPFKLPIDENAQINPTNPYALSKFFAEQICEFYSKSAQVNCTILRLFNVYGIGQSDNFLIPSIMKQASSSNQIEVVDLSPKRDYVYISDVVDAIYQSILYPQIFEIFNIGFGKSYSVEELLQIVQNVKSTNLPIIAKGPSRKDEIMDTIADTKKAFEKLKWKPKVDLINGIKKINFES